MPVVLDFDGTIIDTNYVKRDIIVRYISKIMENGDTPFTYDIGQNRREILEEIFVNEPELVAWHIKQLSDIIDQAVISCRLYDGAKSYLSALHDRNIPIFISTNTPQASIEWILDELSLTPFFSGIFGHPNKKEATLRRIQNMHQGLRVISIGDGEDDLNAARACNVSFFPVNEARGITEDQKIYSFFDLLDELADAPTC